MKHAWDDDGGGGGGTRSTPPDRPTQRFDFVLTGVFAIILIPRLDPSTAKKKREERRLYPAGLVEAT